MATRPPVLKDKIFLADSMVLYLNVLMIEPVTNENLPWETTFYGQWGLVFQDKVCSDKYMQGVETVNLRLQVPSTKMKFVLQLEHTALSPAVFSWHSAQLLVHSETYMYMYQWLGLATVTTWTIFTTILKTACPVLGQQWWYCYPE